MSERHPLWTLLDQAQMDLRNATAKLVAIRAQVAALELVGAPAAAPVCGECGVGAGLHLADCSLVTSTERSAA